MDIHIGDTMIHWTYGLGRVQKVETRIISSQNALYYMIQVDGMTIWVPADKQLDTRLRRPTPKTEFKQLFTILSGPGESLPEDRYKRKTWLLAQLQDGRAESLCRVIRAITFHQQTHSLNETDLVILKRSQKILVSEWSYVFAIPPAQAEHDLQNLLSASQPED